MSEPLEEDLSPIGASDWTRERARHLLDRAGFGGPPEEVARLAAMPPEGAVAWFIDFKAIDDSRLPPFDPSGIYDPSLTPFPPTRPAATRLAADTGAAMGVAAKPAGPRRLQPVADRFFFWLRASMLETRRVTNWWADPPEREFRSRADGIVHHGRWPLHRAGHSRSPPCLYRVAR
jgi:hypothetical protein